MAEYYTMKIAGLERKLEKFPVSDKLDIAAFITGLVIDVADRRKMLEK